MGPLRGVKILDLSMVVAGPFCTMMLGDLGADVVKVERPGDGDQARGWGPPFLEGESAYFLSVNRNKRSITLDLRSEAGRDIAFKLAAGADVVIQNFRPGVMERLGLGYYSLTKLNPTLLYCSNSGLGPIRP